MDTTHKQRMAVTQAIAQCQPTDFNAIMAAVNANNNEKGFTVTTAPAVCRTALFLVIEEIIEAGRYTREKEFDPHNVIVVDGKPEGFGVELADAVMRIMGIAAQLDIDLLGLLQQKHAYNKTRPYMHGKNC